MIILRKFFATTFAALRILRCFLPSLTDIEVPKKVQVSPFERLVFCKQKQYVSHSFLSEKLYLEKPHLTWGTKFAFECSFFINWFNKSFRATFFYEIWWTNLTCGCFFIMNFNWFNMWTDELSTEYCTVTDLIGHFSKMNIFQKWIFFKKKLFCLINCERSARRVLIQNKVNNLSTAMPQPRFRGHENIVHELIQYSFQVSFLSKI